MITLESFIVKAKANGWVGAAPGRKKIPSSRLGSFDITFEEGELFYQDSFVGLTDFCGQEHVCRNGEPVWSMVYYGYIVRPELITGPQVVDTLKAALGAMYREGRFLGGFRFEQKGVEYRDGNKGDFRNFHGKEEILVSGSVVYELLYMGGEVRK